MSENVLAKLTSSKWLRMVILGSAKNFVSSLTFSPSIVEREVAGERHLFHIGNATGKSWYGHHTDTCNEMRFLKSDLLKPGATVIECGAHHGSHTILLSRWVGNNGKVIVVEPIPENVAILERNIEINQLKNVIVVDKAAGPSGGHISMTQNSNGAVSMMPRGKNIQIECIALDMLSQELSLAPTLIKIDVEGFEYQVLEGCKSILSTVPALVIEVHTLSLPRYGKKFEDLWKLVDHNLYDIFIQTDFEEPVSFRPGTVPRDRVHLFFKPKHTNITPL
jgi:FkbM family methyltransferase